MLKFSKEQAAAVIANRRAFNVKQRELAANGLLGNATSLPKDVWGQWDREAITVARSVLAVFDDLSNSVAMTLPIGKSLSYYQTASDSGSATVTMDGRDDGRSDQPTLDYHGTPVPVVRSKFSFGWRQMAAAESEGFNIDVTARDNAFRKVAESLEDGALNGYAGISVNGQASYGLRTHPNRNTRATGATLNGASGADWVTEIVATLKANHAANFRDQATLYLNWDDWFYAQSTDFKANGDKTIGQRVLEIAGVGGVVPSNSVPANEILAVVKRRDVVQVLNAMPITTLPRFRANPDDDYVFMTQAIAAVQIKADAKGQCGVAHSA